jgi:multidrug efflux system outer membrane protein
MSGRRFVSLMTLACLSGCNMAPTYVRPASSSGRAWPTGPAYAPPAAGPAGLPWRQVMGDDRLQRIITTALANNQNLRATVANVAAVRAQYRIQRSNQLPTLAATTTASLAQGITNNRKTDSYGANIGISSFEIDLFGRLKNLSQQAFEQYLASDAGLASTRIALISSIASSYVTMAADQDLLAIARSTQASGERSLELTQSLHASGLAAMTDVANAQTVVAQAKSDVEQNMTLVAQDRNALELLAGGPIDEALLPKSLDELDRAIANVPAGLSSEVLLQRPDVMAAEHQLKGANAAIGAARAAFFPTITLTSAVGVASSALSSLFTGGALQWSAAPRASLPVLGGTAPGNLAYAKAEKDYYGALYLNAIQTAFREVADGLARQGTIGRQRADQTELVRAATKSYALSDAQYRAGTDTFLNALLAQRTLYASRQTQVGVISQDLQNRISLYEYIGADTGR